MDVCANSSGSPLVSVIIPAYNAAGFIEETLDSVLSQTYGNIEVLVVDDGSQDKTAEIVKSMCERDKRVILSRQSNSGVAAARNLGIRMSKGELIAPIDADDIWYPQNIEKQVQCISQEGESVGLVYAWSVDIDEEGLPTGGFRASPIEGDVYPTLLSHNFLGNASASVIRRSCFEKVGYYSQRFREYDAQGCEDWDLYLRIAKFYQFRVVPEFLIGYRQAKNSMSHSHALMAKSHSFMLQSIRGNHGDIPAIIFRLSGVNLYLYFAHQTWASDNHQGSFHWLWQALRRDMITAFLSYRLYTLLIKILLRLITQPLGYLNWPGHLWRAKYKQPSRSKANRAETTHTDPPVHYKDRLSIKFSLLMGDIYHRLIRLVARTRG